MEINKDNFEAFLLDLWEGNLTDVQKAELTSFFERHPELDDGDALSLLSDVSITEPQEEFDKDLINFDIISEKNYEFFFIAYAEDDLNSSEKEMVETFVKTNPSYTQRFNQFQKAKLPVERVVYRDKKGLMGIAGSSPVISIQTRIWLAGVAAASIALFFWFNSSVENIDNKYAMDGRSGVVIESHSSDPFEIDYSKKETNSKSIDNQLKNASFSKHGGNGSKTNRKQNESDYVQNETNKENHSKKESISSIKADELANIVAVINPGQSKQEDAKEDVKNKMQEEIPTVLQLTAAYLQRKKVLNNERKPDLKGLLNNTLANVNDNKEPVLTTNESAGKKRTVFQLGDFKFERIAKK